MAKVSKAKKTSNKKSTKAARRAVLASKLTTSNEKDVKCAPKDFDENSEWEIEVIWLFYFFLVSKLFFFIKYFQEFGGLYLCWGKKKTRKPDGSIGKDYYLKGGKIFYSSFRMSTLFQTTTTAFGLNGRWLSATKSDGRLKNKVKFYFTNQPKNCHVRSFGWCLQG